MTKQAIGGVQAHSVGEHYPIIVVGFGDGTWRAEYGGAHSGRFPRSWHASAVARLAFDVLTRQGVHACRLWLLNEALPGKLPLPVYPVDAPDAVDPFAVSACAQLPRE